MATTELRSPLLPFPPPPPPPPQRQRRRISARAAALAISATVVLLLVPLLIASSTTGWSTSRRHPAGPRSSSSSNNAVELTLLTDARDKGAVCLDGSPPGYHLQRGSGAGSSSWLVHLMGGGWCDTVRSCSARSRTYLGSSLYMEKLMNFSGILSNDPAQNPDFYSWNRVFVRYCDGASFSGDSQLQVGNGTLFFRGLRIWEAVLDDLMQKGLAHSKQALLTGCSAGGLATLLHCNDFRARFPPEVTVKCLPDAGFFVDAKDLSGQRSMRSVYDGVVHLQNVTQVLPKDCLLANKDPTQCFFPAELIRSISAPTLIVNSAYDSWQVQYVVAPDGSSPDESWRSCRVDVGRCNSSQIQVLNAFRKQMVGDLEAADDNSNSSWFIDSCFTHCQTIYDNSGWNSKVAPRLGNKTLVETIGDWYFDRSPSPVVRQVGCEYPCNPTCHSDQSATSCQLVQQSSSARTY